jgi:hypothetical protein
LLILGPPIGEIAAMASTNKCLAQSNKSETGGKATKKRPDGSRRIDETADYGETDNECDYENRDGAGPISQHCGHGKRPRQNLWRTGDGRLRDGTDVHGDP